MELWKCSKTLSIVKAEEIMRHIREKRETKTTAGRKRPRFGHVQTETDEAMISIFPPHNLPYLLSLSVPFFSVAPPPPRLPLLPPLLSPPLFWGQIRFLEKRLSPESERRGRRENTTRARRKSRCFVFLRGCLVRLPPVLCHLCYYVTCC